MEDIGEIIDKFLEAIVKEEDCPIDFILMNSRGKMHRSMSKLLANKNFIAGNYDYEKELLIKYLENGIKICEEIYKKVENKNQE